MIAPAAKPQTVYVADDSTAIAAGANRVAAELSRLPNVRVVRTSSRGAFFLEPMVEVDTPQGRAAYLNVQPREVPGLFRKKPVPLARIPFLAKQTRYTFARFGENEPLDLAGYGFRAWQKAREMSPQQILAEIKRANLRGRGGAAFPAGIKWQTTADTPTEPKYIVANADEGDPGTYADRMILEGEPYRLLEGMMIAARAVGARQGYIYIRSEYPAAIQKMRAAIAQAREFGVLSESQFDVDVVVGAGAYICGEETALLESIEGKRGMVRYKPPFPAVEGLWGKPTVINNVITLATVPDIILRGADWHLSLGTETSKGTMPLQLAGQIRQPGLVEVPFGLTLEEVIYDFGGGLPRGCRFKAVQVGGPLGALFPARLLNTRICFDALAKAGGILGHGGIVVYDDQTDMVQLAHHFMEFTANESCGKCTPCRIGSTRASELLQAVLDGDAVPEDIALLRELGDTMKNGSLCGLGAMAPAPVLTALEYFPNDFGRRL
ncbi:MAG: SLBB domain-containing protein [Verrucomicrobiae bacterium]|nr:SLBB domain-containing protein [Verrucomicrobiae bacterium]MDW8344311.1 NADH-ubiquinone oxidoreductase-F iron-sulfur binding region domain-containing protein [Verrucomicrobiae bacterium]